MPTNPDRIQRLHQLIWALIYLGLFGMIIGVVIRQAAPLAGPALIVLGVLAAAAGVALIYLRSRLNEQTDDASPP